MKHFGVRWLAAAFASVLAGSNNGDKRGGEPPRSKGPASASATPARLLLLASCGKDTSVTSEPVPTPAGVQEAVDAARVVSATARPSLRFIFGNTVNRYCYPALLVVAAMLAYAPAAPAREVTVPIELDHEFLRRGLLAQVYTDPGDTARVWDDGSGCNFMVLSSPQVDTKDRRVRVVSAGKARVGTAIGGQCLVILNWSGFIEAFEDPVVDPSAPIVRFHVVDSNIYGPDWKKQLTTGVLWDWMKKYVQPRLGALTVDLQGAFDELRNLLPLVLPSAQAAQTQALLDSLKLGSVQPTAEGMNINLRFDVAEQATAAAVPQSPAPEPTLSPQELQRWELALDQWDAFLTFVVKQAGNNTAAAELRQALLGVLLDERYDLLDALAPTRPGEPDPVPGLFVKTWSRLAPVLRKLSASLPGDQALRYLSFISAADALEAIQQLGPAATGLDISADGLRRLARMLAPATAEDPLAYSAAVDPELRRLFGFGPPLPVPADNPDVDLTGWFRQWFVGDAWAAREPDKDLVARLNHWVPANNEIDTYLPMVRDLLDVTVKEVLADKALEQKHHKLYRWVILTTAWQETCWRQFIKEKGKIKPITSAVGSVGLMQVNQHVWRGFYEVRALKGDIGYNARAGSEIALHYIVDVVLPDTKTTDDETIARATYQVYNGGPGQLRRFFRKKLGRGARLVDRAFAKKFKQIKAGDELAVASCYGD